MKTMLNSLANGSRVTCLGLLLTFAAGAAWAQGNCTATGTDAACRGTGSEAIGNVSTAIGSQTIACNGNSSAYGLATMAESDNSFVVGRFNAVAGTPGQCSPMTIAGQEPLFVVGNGLGPQGPPSEANKNAFSVLKNGTTVVGTVRGPDSTIGPLSTLNVVGNAFVAQDLAVGRGMITVSRDGGKTGFRDLGIWVAGAPRDQLSCDAACGTGVCLAAYSDQQSVVRVGCDAMRPNRNCLCAGRK